jgi:hypothetical protein
MYILKEEIGMDAYQRMANGIITQAYIDYVTSLRERHRLEVMVKEKGADIVGEFGNNKSRKPIEKLRRFRRYVAGLECEIQDLENFFTGGWFMSLTRLDGYSIMRKIKREEEANGYCELRKFHFVMT